jgi:membrane peptidoglycan carboxypeptidase
MKLQETAEKAVRDGMAEIRRQGGDNAAFVGLDNKTGQIVSLVGGIDFNDENSGYSKLNFGHDVKVSPGSTFKPYDYAIFIDNNNAGAGSVFYDTQGPLPGYPCTVKARPKDDKTANCLWDYDFRYPGPITIRYALGGSRNLPAVKAMLSAVPNDSSAGRVASINKVINTANAMMTGNSNSGAYACYPPGTDTFSATKEDATQCYGSSAIGDGAYLHLDDHANGLATLARNGQYVPRTYIMKITDASNKVINEFKQPAGKQIIKADSAYIVNDMLSDPNASYLPGRCTATSCTELRQGGYKFHRMQGTKIAIKTGTTNDGFDGLMAAWSNQYTSIAWVGYHTRNKAMVGRGMEYMTAPIVRPWMQAATDNLVSSGVKLNNWTQPSGVKALPAFVVRNHVGVASVEPSPSNDLFPSWYQQPKGSSGSSQTLDKVSNKTATSCTPELAKQTVGGGNDNAFSVDLFFGPRAGTSTGSSAAADDIHNCNDNKPDVRVSAPDECDATTGCTITVLVTAGTHPLSSEKFPGTVNLLINGQVVQTKSVSDSPSNLLFEYKPTGAGSFTVEAQVIDSVLYSTNSGAETVQVDN